MSGIGNLGSVLFAHPIIGLIVFLAVSAGVLMVLSGGQLMSALGGILRVFVTVFTTPFVFLRDALTILRSSGEAEQDYRKTRVFMLYRYSRIQYLGILVISLLALSGGITASLISLYPSGEMAQHKALSEQIRSLQDDIKATEKDLAAAATPAHRKTLEDRRTEADQKLQQQRQSNAAFQQSSTFRGPLISQIQNARRPESLAEVANAIDDYMADCPLGYSWGGFSEEQCAAYRAFATELAQRKTTELALSKAFEEADIAFNDADNAARNAETRLETLKSSLKSTREQRGQVSLFNPGVIASKLGGAIAILISSLLLVIVIVWFGALFIDFLNWIILLMRVAEKDASSKLDHADKEYQ